LEADDVFRRLPGGSYEVFEEGKDVSPVTLSGFSITVAKATDTLSFDSVHGKETRTLTERRRYLRPVYALLAQQSDHVQRLLRHCDLCHAVSHLFVIVSHSDSTNASSRQPLVDHSRNVRYLGVVSVKTLVQERQSEQICRCFQRGSGAFATSKHGGCVVSKGGSGGFPDVKVLGDDVWLAITPVNSKSEFVTRAGAKGLEQAQLWR
jgi:hypothetical protein